MWRSALPAVQPPISVALYYYMELCVSGSGWCIGSWGLRYCYTIVFEPQSVLAKVLRPYSSKKDHQGDEQCLLI